ncbi:MAG: TM1812 family CRISPR-associated protein [Christensenellaceae bacterium]
MGRNVLIVYLSLLNATFYQSEKCVSYTAPQLQNPIVGMQTNEAAVQYIIQKLNSEHQHLDEIIAFCSKQVREDNLEKEDRNKKTTTFDYFTDKVKTYPNGGNKITIKKIETNDVLNVNEQVKKMKKLSQYLFSDFKATSEDKFYIDFTGGKRDSAMLLINIMHLLEFRQLELKEITYADMNAPVTDEQRTGNLVDCTYLYKMSDIITAMDDFFSYGSAAKLSTYFKDSENHDLNNLLMSLKAFSEHLSLCRVSFLNDDIDNISEYFGAYRKPNNSSIAKNTEENNYKESFFRLLVARIESEFAEIFKADKVNRIVPICEWCYKKDMLQQAESIINEQFPSIICQNMLLLPTKAFVKAEENKKREKDYYDTWPRYIFKALLHQKDENNKNKELDINIIKQNMVFCDKVNSQGN